eukprot:GILI01019320.1.p1 GENE.GILI01019320.1~~GILI01019320.1.p1  ORF type:complete len:155 (+),score=41.74 GILI01019320.1:87-551(+)
MASRAHTSVDSDSSSKDARREMAEKLKQFAKTPEIAQLQIKQLDQMVFKLKKDRRDCQERIDKARAELSWLEKEEAEIRLRYDPLVSSLEAKEVQRTQLQQQIAQFERETQAVIELTKTRLRQANQQDSRFNKQKAAESVALARGRTLPPIGKK